MKTTIILTDTFNQRELSRHRTVEAAVKAQRKHARAIERNNGRGSFVWYSITSTTGEDIADEVACARHALDCGRF